MFTLKAFPILKIIDHNDRWSVKWQSKLNNKKKKQINKNNQNVNK